MFGWALLAVFLIALIACVIAGKAEPFFAVVGALAVGAILTFVVGLCCAFDGLYWYDYALYIGAGVAIELLLIFFMAGKLNRRTLPLLLGLLILCAGGKTAVQLYRGYVNSIAFRDTFDARDYRPWQENSLVKTLEEPAALQFAANPPKMDGATALYPVYAAFAQAVYPASLADLSVTEQMEYVDCSTTTLAYKNIVDGGADIIFVAGPSAKQEEYAKEKGVELIYTPIGREAFVFFVNPGNPLNSLTIPQIRGIYSGEITRWEELGAPGLGGILAFQRSIGSGSQTALYTVMGDTPLMEPPTENVYGSMGGIVEAASDYKNFKNAIGYSFRFYCTELKKGFDVKLLALNGIAPTRENIENGTYPIASYFYAVTRADADENTRALLAWIQGPQGQTLIDQTGYTPVAVPGEGGKP